METGGKKSPLLASGLSVCQLITVTSYRRKIGTFNSVYIFTSKLSQEP